MMSDRILGGFYRDSSRAQRFQTLIHCYLKTIGSEIKSECSLELENAILRFFGLKHKETAKLGTTKDHGKSPKVG